MNTWTPTTDLLTLRRMGKLGEELGEAQVVAARVIIQGIDEVDPGSGKVNRQRLMDELADVQAQIGCTVLAFDLDQDYMGRRTAEKIRRMEQWDALFAASAAPTEAASTALPAARRQIIYALERSAAQLEHDADRLLAERNYDAQFPEEDALRHREAIEILAAAPAVVADLAPTMQQVDEPLREIIAFADQLTALLGVGENTDDILAEVARLKSAQPEALTAAPLSEFYIAGPFHDGTYAVGETATGRLIRMFRGAADIVLASATRVVRVPAFGIVGEVLACAEVPQDAHPPARSGAAAEEGGAS